MSHPDRRATDSSRFPLHILSNNLPWPVEVGLFLLFWLGPCVIVAAVFMSMWAGWIPSPITENGRILVRVEAKLDGATERMAREVASSRNQDEYVVRLLLATCRNVARNDVDRLQCENYWKR